MLRVQPVTENEATGTIQELFVSIKETIGSPTVPVIFQYLAAFPEYFSFLWQQAEENISSPQFHKEAEEIRAFAEMAMQTCYSPSAAISVFLQPLRARGEYAELHRVVGQLLYTNSLLYLLALAIRESLKGKYLGIKQIGLHLSEEERDQFFTFSSSPPSSSSSPAHSPGTSQARDIRRAQTAGLVVTPYGQFFSHMDREMKHLLKNERYLFRRVELERFALAKLALLPSPLDSSFVSVTQRSAEHPHFADLIYLLADVFPTETPYKLLSASVMERALIPSSSITPR